MTFDDSAALAYERLRECHRGYSQRERTVRYLAGTDGWRSIMEIHRNVGFCRLNSRVAEARKVFRRDGHPFDIVHSIRDGQHGYELVPLEEGATDSALRKEARAGANEPLAAPSSSGSNLIPELGLPHAQDEDGSLFDCYECADGEGLPPGRSCGYCGREAPVLEGQGQLL